MVPKTFKLEYIHAFFLVLGLLIGYILGTYFPLTKVFDFSGKSRVVNIKDVKGVKKGQEEAVIKEEDEPCDMKVEVAGAVNLPGVYCFTKGSVVNEALNKSGGLNRLAAMRYVSQRVNLAQTLTGNEKLYFPYEDDLKCEMLPFIADRKLDNLLGGDDNNGCISLNGATRKELETLKGVGEVTASKIVEGRPYSNGEELKDKSVISEKLYESIKESICL